jgi:calcineurin-like phosphoesterase family protein
MNMTRFFTADTHFGHANVIKHSKRPFISVEKMDAELVWLWNSRVGPNDEVFHAGDFAWREPEKYIDQLHGRLHLITGNHDHKQTRKLSRWLSVQPYLELKDKEFGLLVLCHYPLLTWNRAHYGTVHLHGHSHNTLQQYGRRFDVGVDNPTAAFMPWSAASITYRFLTAPSGSPVDHHITPEVNNA